MAVKTYTSETLAQAAVARQAPETPPSPVVGSGAETISTAPDPAVNAPGEKPVQKRHSVQDRIDELTKQRKEMEEFAASEYEARMQLQERLKQVEGQQPAVKAAEPAKPSPAPVPADDPEPVYVEGDATFLTKWGEWNRRQAVREFEAKGKEESAKQEAERLAAEANARRDASVKAAREQYADFDEVMRSADVRAAASEIPAPPPDIQATLRDSDHSAQLLYHFVQNPDEARKIFAMRPRQAALAIGRLETRFEKQQATPPKAAEPPTKTPAITRAPPPMPSLNGADATPVNTDLSQTMPFKEYKAKRLEEIRRGRKH